MAETRASSTGKTNNNLDSCLNLFGFEFLDLSPQKFTPRLLMIDTFYQPFKVLHGGLSAFISESLSSIGAHLTSGLHRAAGIELSINHVKSVGISDHVIAEETPTRVVKTIQEKIDNPVTKVELGRSTWTLLHTLAAQYPDNPTRQQKKDVKELMGILSRLYPCKECADHFKELLRGNPVEAGSQSEFSQWLCHVHNVVNRSLGKQGFPCQRVEARWGKMECERHACDLQGSTTYF